MTTVRSGRLVKSRRSPSKKAKGRVHQMQFSNEYVREFDLSFSLRPSQYQGSPPRVSSPRARENRDKPASTTTNAIIVDRNPSIQPLSRHLVLLWKCITNVNSSKKSRRFSYIPDGFTKIEIQHEPRTPRAKRRHAGFWDGPILPPPASTPESE